MRQHDSVVREEKHLLLVQTSQGTTSVPRADTFSDVFVE